MWHDLLQGTMRQTQISDETDTRVGSRLAKFTNCRMGKLTSTVQNLVVTLVITSLLMCNRYLLRSKA